jgi:hypothetical protein
MSWNFRGFVLAGVSAVALAACTSGRNETLKPESPEATTAQPSVPDSGPSAQQHREAYSPPSPMARPDAGFVGSADCAACGPRERCVNGRCSRCGPDEMDCCGACIPKSEKRCPDNIHCPPPDPVR